MSRFQIHPKVKSQPHTMASASLCHRRLVPMLIYHRHRQPSVINHLYGRLSLSQSQPPLPQQHQRHLSNVTDNGNTVHKLGLGGHKWARMNAEDYTKLVQSAMKHGMTTLEAGPDGENALVEAVRGATDKNSNNNNLTMTARLGYRTLVENKEENRMQQDVTVEEHAIANNPTTEEHTNNSASATRTAEVVHNISREAVLKCLADSPLVKLKKEINLEDTTMDINLIYMLHNPEVQGDKDRVMERMVDAFCGMEEGVANGQISSYGVCSNGLALPDSHALHLPWTSVLEAAYQAMQQVHGTTTTMTSSGMKKVSSNLTTLQLPINLMETNGFLVARDLAAFFANQKQDPQNSQQLVLQKALDVYAMRPLSCYPNQGTEAEHPYQLVDYNMTPITSTTATATACWTHEMNGPPPTYSMALNAALGHFDATEILEVQAERKLTTEERETLDGCKLLHSMLHDLDVSLGNVPSLLAYEEELYSRVIPLIHDTFEELDEDSATVLQAFFAAHGAAVRYEIATRTRTLLVEGDSKKWPKYHIPKNITLQDYALQFMLREGSISKVIVGYDEPNQVVEAVHAAAKY